MVKTVDLLDLIKARYNLPSDYALAKKLSVTQSCISLQRKNHRSMAESTLIRVAELLDLPLSYLLICAQIERANDDKLAHVWRTLATQCEAEIKHKKQRNEQDSERREGPRWSL